MINKTLLFFILCSNFTYAQQWEWVRNVNGAANDYTSDIFVDDSSNIYTTGRNKEGVTFEDETSPITPANYGHTDAFVTKYSKDGELIWAKLIGGSEPDWGWGVCADKLGNVYFTGEFSGTATFGPDVFVSNGDRDVFVSKLDQNGNFLWTKVFGGPDEDKGKGIDVDDAGNVYVTGHIKGVQIIGNSTLGTAGVTNAFMVKLDSQGNFIHEKDIQPDISYGNKIKCDNLGNVYLCGELLYDSYVADFLVTGATTLSWRDGYIAKLDTAFNCEWVKVVQGSLHTSVESFDFNQSFIYTTGFFTYQSTFNDTTLTYSGTGTGSTGINAGRDIYIAKYDLNGNRIWVKGIGAEGYDYGYDISVTENDEIYTCGIFEDTVQFDSFELIADGGIDQYILKADGNGNIIWVKQHGSVADIYAYATGIDDRENLYVGGMYEIGSTDFDGIIKGTTQFDAYVGKLTQHTYPELSFLAGNYCEGDTVKLSSSTITSPMSVGWENMNPIGWQDGDNYCFIATAGTTSFSGELITANNLYSDTLIFNESLNVVAPIDCGIGINEDKLAFNWVYNSTNQLFIIDTELDGGNIKAISMNGSVLLNQPLSAGISTLDLSSFSRGVYMITISNKFNELEVVKIVR